MSLRLPGLIDVHVHLREPGAAHKEDWASGTAAALAGGFTTVLAMPNTHPSISDEETLKQCLQMAAQKAHCDHAQYIGGGPDNAMEAASLADQAAGLKLYLDQTYGDLKMDGIQDWMPHFKHWPSTAPLAVHAEGKTLAAAILLAALHERPIHLCHVSRREEILLIRSAKEKGLPITCEVTPHHLFLSEEDIPDLGQGRAEVRPRLATREDQAALWENLDVIDCFASDHAPHTLEEKDDQRLPGFPGLETTLPLLLTAVTENRLTIEDLTTRLFDNPRRIFGLPKQAETYIEIDPDVRYEIHARDQHTRCGWTPFEGWKVRGRLKRVVLRGKKVYEGGRVLAQAGSGKNIRS